MKDGDSDRAENPNDIRRPSESGGNVRVESHMMTGILHLSARNKDDGCRFQLDYHRGMLPATLGHEKGV